MLSLRKFACRPDTVILSAFKSLRILKYRGNGSIKYKHQQPINNHTLKIEIAQSRRLSQSAKERPAARRLPQKVTLTRSVFAVPKFMLINICNLSKIKNRVRASVALESDLIHKDVDVCVVSETHLKHRTCQMPWLIFPTTQFTGEIEIGLDWI